MSRIANLFPDTSPSCPRKGNRVDHSIDDLMLLDDVRPSPECIEGVYRHHTRQSITPVNSNAYPESITGNTVDSIFTQPNMMYSSPQQFPNVQTVLHSGQEMMQCYSSERERIGILGSIVAKQKEETDRLTNLVCNLSQRLQSESNNFQQERDMLKRNNEMLNNKIEHLRQQMDENVRNHARKMAELMEDNRLKEEEVQQLKKSMLSLKRENERLEIEEARGRSVSIRMGRNGSGDRDESVSRRTHEEALASAQWRAVELAKKLLECEQAKRSAEEALIAVHNKYMRDQSTIELMKRTANRDPLWDLS